ncbi:MAG: hypothetical protein ACKO2G_15035 [Verrucomicrobiales bacterium]
MNPREQRLLAAFLLVIVAMVSWLGYGRLQDRQNEMREQATSLRTAAERDQSFLDAYEGELSGARDWLAERLGPPLTPQQADIKLVNAVEESAKSASLSLVTPKFLSPLEKGSLRLARYSATVTGSEGYIYPWLANFHNPENLRCISGLTIKPDKDDETIVVCEVEFGQWYLPDYEEALDSP